MADNTNAKLDASGDFETRRLRDLRLKLLRLHQSLLDRERAAFEKRFGRVNSGELLQLAINHPQFAWLRIISALVVQIDEMLDEDEPPLIDDMRTLVEQARLLLTSTDKSEFREKYQSALQDEPAVVVAHSEVMQLLRQET